MRHLGQRRLPRPRCVARFTHPAIAKGIAHAALREEAQDARTSTLQTVNVEGDRVASSARLRRQITPIAPLGTGVVGASRPAPICTLRREELPAAREHHIGPRGHHLLGDHRLHGAVRHMRHKGTRRGMGDAGVGDQPCRLARGPRSLQHGRHSVSARVQTQHLRRRRLTRRELRRGAGRIDHQRARRRVQREPHPTAIGERPVVGHTVGILRGRSLARPEFKQPNLLRPHAVADEEDDIARPLHLRGPRRLRCLCANRRAGRDQAHDHHQSEREPIPLRCLHALSCLLRSHQTCRAIPLTRSPSRKRFCHLSPRRRARTSCRATHAVSVSARNPH